jgi:hypothetical protein
MADTVPCIKLGAVFDPVGLSATVMSAMGRAKNLKACNR